MIMKTPPRWSVPEREAAPQSVFWNRRELIRRLAAAGVMSALASAAGANAAQKPERPQKDAPLLPPPKGLYPARRNERYESDAPATPERIASRYNVFDEFAVERTEVWKSMSRFSTSPWRIQIGGAVEKQLQFDVDDLIRRMGIEERLYRFRCVETWAMVVPWSGFPFRRFLDLVKPLAAAKYVRMVSAARPEEMPNWYGSRRVFPYYEALSLEEAGNDLAFLATGIYGHPLPPQHGAPLRLITPWKYGLKGIKSIVAFEFTRERPGTFWNELAPQHYSFLSNVDPAGEGQAEETVLDTGEKRKTKLYNGYAAEVAALYA